LILNIKYSIRMSLLHGTSGFYKLVLYWVLIGVACNRQPPGGCGGLETKLVTGQGALI
jgi:hypothetical protein